MCQLWTESEPYAVESAFEPLDDLISVGMIGELLDWARLDPVLMRLADPSRTYLCGHSRVGLPASLAFFSVPHNGVSVIMYCICSSMPISQRCPSAYLTMASMRHCDLLQALGHGLPCGMGACKLHSCAYSGKCNNAQTQGGKLSVLAAVADPRVKAVFLADPVDSTVWAPEARPCLLRQQVFSVGPAALAKHACLLAEALVSWMCNTS